MSATITLQVFRQESGTAYPDYLPRPRRFTVKSGTGLMANIADLGDCNALAQWVQFTEHGKRYAASLAFGKDVTKAQRNAAYRVLDTLRVSN